MIEVGEPDGRYLHDPEVLAEGEVGVLAPAERRVEPLGSVDIGHGQNDHLERRSAADA
jgi:hypothetical protein